jgi:hypothetical protein
MYSSGSRYEKMRGQQRKGRFSIRSLICTSNANSEWWEEGEDLGPLASAMSAVDEDESVTNPPFEDLYDGPLNIDDVTPSVCDGNDPKTSQAEDIIYNTTASRRIKHWQIDNREEKPKAYQRSLGLQESSSGPGSPMMPKRQPSPRRGMSPSPPVPHFIGAGTNFSNVGRSNKASAGKPPLPDTSPTSTIPRKLHIEDVDDSAALFKRVDAFKARAEHLLVQGPHHQKRTEAHQGMESVKSFGSSSHTEPTIGATASASSTGSLSDRIDRVHRTTNRLNKASQRLADDHSDTSSIPTRSGRTTAASKSSETSAFGSRRSGSVHVDVLSKQSVSFQDSMDLDSIPDQEEHNETGSDVLRIISILEAINGYDLSVDDLDTSTDSNSVNLEFSFLKV